MESIDTNRTSTMESSASDTNETSSDSSFQKKIESKPKLTAFETVSKQMGGFVPHAEDINISENLREFYQIRKHYLILTDAGKPVYSRYGDE